MNRIVCCSGCGRDTTVPEVSKGSIFLCPRCSARGTSHITEAGLHMKQGLPVEVLSHQAHEDDYSEESSPNDCFDTVI